MGRKHDTGLPWVDRSVDVDGVPVHYLEAGRGETLLLVHGGLVWCSAELTYGAVIPLLARTFRVVAVDVVGFGLTPGREPDDFSAQAQGRFLVRFLETIGGPAHIAGNSHGGWLVQYLAHEVPHLISRMVIINSLNGTDSGRLSASQGRGSAAVERRRSARPAGVLRTQGAGHRAARAAHVRPDSAQLRVRPCPADLPR